MTNKIRIILVIMSLLIISGCSSNQLTKSKSFSFKTKDLNTDINYPDKVITLEPRTNIKQRFIL